MAKDVTPEGGVRVVDSLEILRDSGIHGATESVNQAVFLIAKEIGMTANITTCSTRMQEATAEKAIEKMAKELRQKNPYVEPATVATDFMEGEMLTRFYSLAALLNSFNHQCMNCLNAECGHRDKKYPVQKVQKRV